MSLAVLVRVAIPALVAIGTAAYFLFRNKPEEEQAHGEPGMPPRRIRDTSRARDSSNQTRRRRRREDLEECCICMVEKVLIDLYPCKHRIMCEECTLKVITCNKRLCPVCRRGIHGYADPKHHV